MLSIKVHDSTFGKRLDKRGLLERVRKIKLFLFEEYKIAAWLKICKLASEQKPSLLKKHSMDRQEQSEYLVIINSTTTEEN